MTEEQAREKTAKRIADKLKEWKVEKHLGETETSVEMMLAWREDCIRALLADERVKELTGELDEANEYVGQLRAEVEKYKRMLGEIRCGSALDYEVGRKYNIVQIDPDTWKMIQSIPVEWYNPQEPTP